MKKLLWGLAAGLLVVSTLSVQAGEKLYRIKLASSKEGVFGKPVAYQEIVPSPAPLEAPGAIETPPAPFQPVAPGGLRPVPEPAPLATPNSQPPVETYQTVELYPYVKYEDLDNVHPFGVKRIVAVKDPRVPQTNLRHLRSALRVRNDLRPAHRPL